MVDISTPKEVFDKVDQAVTALFAAHPTEFSGQHLVVANFAGDPLKYTLCVWCAPDGTPAVQSCSVIEHSSVNCTAS